MNSVKALTFDVFGTLVDWRSSVSRQLSEYFVAHAHTITSPSGIDWDAVAQDWRARYQPSMQAVRSGERSFVILDVLHRESLLATLESHAISCLSDVQLDELTLLWHQLDGWPDVSQGLVRLREHYTLAALSNGNAELLKNLSSHADLAWHVSLGAEATQSYKPQARTYLQTAAMLTLAPEQCMMVAAHNEDLHAARKLGFRTAYINRPTEYGERQSCDFGPESNWDFSVDSMTELADQLILDES